MNAKRLLDDLGAKYTAVELDIRDDGKAFRAELGQVREAPVKTTVCHATIERATFLAKEHLHV